MQTGKKRILLIGGSINQTTQMHQIALHLQDYETWFTPYYADGLVGLLQRAYLLEPTILGHKLRRRTENYFAAHHLPVDSHGRQGGYDLVLTCADLIVPQNIRHAALILVQEGMTDPEGFRYRLVKRFRWLPRWIASTAANGLSDAYEVFCVASEGYRDLFVRKGATREKLCVTGIPNFDNCAQYLTNDFPHRNYVLVCTSDTRETWGYENRKRTIENAVRIANGRKLIFKLHPNENVSRATREINRYAPGALVYATGKTEHMIANADVLITRFSTTAYVGLALGKEVYSEFDVEELRRMTPIQNGSAAQNIAAVCRFILDNGRWDQETFPGFSPPKTSTAAGTPADPLLTEVQQRR